MLGIVCPVRLGEAARALLVCRVAELAYDRLERQADEDEYIRGLRKAAVGEDLAKGAPDRFDNVLPGVNQGAVEVKEGGCVPENGDFLRRHSRCGAGALVDAGSPQPVARHLAGAGRQYLSR